jgi:CHAT domain-containing protein/tetratricopeptide (TPR) repeat protein
MSNRTSLFSTSDEPRLGAPSVDDALDLLWLIDMGQGNLALAEAAADQALAGGPSAEAFLARAVVHHLRGEYNAALPRFEAAFVAASDDEARVKIAAMAQQCEIARAGLLADGRYVCFPESEAAWGDPRQTDTPWSERLRALEDIQIAPLYRNISHLLTVLSAFQPARDLALMFRPASAAKLLQGYAHPLLELTRWNSEVIRAQLILLSSELHGLSGDLATALRALDELKQTAESDDNPLIAARAQLCRADLLATPAPLGLPPLFGYPVREDAFGNAGLLSPDPGRYRRSAIDAAQASTGYEEARTLFERAGALRGVALAECRLGYLDLITGGWESAYTRYGGAQRTFARLGDVLNQHAAYAGQIVASWRGAAPLGSITSACRELGTHARDNGRLSWGIGFGLAFTEAGMEALATLGDVEAAERATLMAEALFDALETPSWRAMASLRRAAALATIDATDDAEIVLASELQRQTSLVTNSPAEARYAAAAGVWTATALFGLSSQRADPEALRRVRTSTSSLKTHLRSVTEAEFASAVAGAVKAAEAAERLAREDLGPDGIRELNAAMEDGKAREDDIRQYQHWYLAEWIERHATLLEPFWRGVMLTEWNQAREAQQHFEDALRAAEALPDRHYHQALIYSRAGRKRAAIAAAHRFVAAGMPMDRPVPRAMDTVPDPARPESLLGQPRGRPFRLVAQLCSDLGLWEEARQHYIDAGADPDALEPIDATPSELDIIDRLNFALIAEGRGDDDSALAHFRQAASGVETRRRLLRRERFRRLIGSQRWVQSVYAEWARVLVDTGDLAAACDVAERGRARVMTELMAQGKGMKNDLESRTADRAYREAASKVERLTSLLATAGRSDTRKTRVDPLRIERDIALEELAEQEGRLTAISPRRGALALPDEVLLTVDGLAERLPEGTVVLAYQFFHERLLAWAIGRAGLLDHSGRRRLGGRTFKARPFGACVLDWVRRLSDGDYDVQTAAELAGALITPFDHVIEKCQHVVFIPFAELNMVPLHVLDWRGAPLGFSRTTSYLPAASVLQFLPESRKYAAGAVVVGDPSNMALIEATTGSRRDLSRLPAGRIEAYLIARLYGSTPLIGPAATEPDVRRALAERPRIIHLATHAYLQPGSPLDSGIALADGSALSADEITGLDLGADVAVLSACDTGRGALQGSELVGLTRALLCADVRSAIVSLWGVDDTATPLLMTRLHRELRLGTAPAEALATSQRSTAATTADEALDFYHSAERELAAVDDPELPASFRTCVDDILELADGDLSRPVFAPPAFWGTFCLVGSWD